MISRQTPWLCVLAIILVLAATLAWPATCPAQETFAASLADLAPEAGERLGGMSDSVTVKLPVPERWDAANAVLSLRYTHSTALLPDRSQIVVLLDGFPLVQAALDSPHGMDEIAAVIPAEMLASGYHDLVIEVAQRSTDECQDPMSPELWTLLDLEASTLSLDYSLRPLPPSLERSAAMLFDDKQPQGLDLLVVMEEPTPARLKAAAIAVSAAAVRLGYRPLRIVLAQDVDRSMDCLLLGSPEFVAAKLACSGRDLPAGNLALHFGPEIILDNATRRMDDEHGLLVLMGDSDEELLLAARGLALLDPLPDLPDIAVTEAVAPQATRHAGANMLEPGGEYLFSELGFATQTFQGLAPAPQGFSFRLASDLLLRENQELTLVFDLSYGSAMRADSVLNVFVNNAFGAAVSLDGQPGARYRSFAMPLPAVLFRPGVNTIRFAPALTPLTGGPCEFLQTGNLDLTVSGDSVLRVPEADHWTAMPRMELFFQDGFPLAALPDWSGATVVVTDNDPASLSAALNLVAMVCQANGMAPLSIAFDQAVPEQGDVLLVGGRDSLPSGLVEDTLLALGRESLPGGGHVSWQTPESGSATSSGAIRLAQFRSTLSGAGTVLAVTADEPDALLRGALALWDPGIRSQCAGALTAFDPSSPESSLRTIKAEDYYLGSAGGIGVVDRFLQANPMLGGALLLAGGFVMAWGMYRLLRSRKRSGGSGHGS